jgi:hypothetical protein
MSTSLDEEFRLSYGARGVYGSPATPAEIDVLESEIGLRLPAAYRGFLLQAGHYPPHALVGSDCSIANVPKLRGYLEEVLRNDGAPFELPADAVVFLSHQGYIYFYFQCDNQSEDPPVWRYNEGKRVPVRDAERFSWWVKSLEPAPEFRNVR